MLHTSCEFRGPQDCTLLWEFAGRTHRALKSCCAHGYGLLQGRICMNRKEPRKVVHRVGPGELQMWSAQLWTPGRHSAPRMMSLAASCDMSPGCSSTWGPQFFGTPHAGVVDWPCGWSQTHGPPKIKLTQNPHPESHCSPVFHDPRSPGKWRHSYQAL